MADGKIITIPAKPKLYKANSIKEILQEFRLFTVAPLYVSLNIPFDLVVQFRAEYGDCNHIQIETDEPILGNIVENYKYFLEGIELDKGGEFTRYLKHGVFSNENTQTYAEVIWQDVDLTKCSTQKIEALFPSYTVFMPDSNKGRMQLTNETPPNCTYVPANPEIVARATKLFEGYAE